MDVMEQRPAQRPPECRTSAAATDVSAFLCELSELSWKHGVAIGGEPILFVMAREDYDCAYAADEMCELHLANTSA